jgi:hypothetical protein
MQAVLSFFGLTSWTPYSVVVGALLLFIVSLFVGLLVYGVWHGIKHWRDCHGQPWIEVEGRVLSKEYTPADSGSRLGYGYGFDPSNGSFGYRYGLNSYSDPESHDVEVLVENQQLSFPVTPELYAQLETSRAVRVLGRRGKNSRRFHAKAVMGPVSSGSRKGATAVA